MKLTLRLEELSRLIDKHKKGNILADIGTDHAYLPCYLVENHIVDKAYACDVVEGPYLSSIKTVEMYKFTESVFPLLGDGLDPILDKETHMISIAGMGAYLMSEILEKNRSYLKEHVLFLQPNANADHLRKYLYENGFDIIDESMISEGHHIYEMMVVVISKNETYDESDILFGPVLKKMKNDSFIKYWNKQYRVYKKIMSDLDENHSRYKELKHLTEMIEGVLNVS